MPGEEQPFPLGLRPLIDELNSVLLERVYQSALMFEPERAAP
jgi:hypothetical protein